MKQTIFKLLFLLVSIPAIAQTGVRGTVIDAITSEALPDVSISILGDSAAVQTDGTGTFSLTEGITAGEQILVVLKTGYVTKRLPIIINEGQTLTLETITLDIDVAAEAEQIGLISLSDNQVGGDDDDAGTFNVSGLLTASRDVFLNAAAFDFSATFFRPRGLDNANGKVLINGIEMNKQFNGRPQWGNWGGLNDVQRNREFSMGLSANEYTFGGLAGTTNIIMRASQYRQGGRVSYAAANRSYTGRVMASYNSGLLGNGWAYSFSAARRFGDEGFVDGTFYDANSFSASVEKKLGDNHSLNLTAFYTPNRRGRSTAITQEVFDLKGREYNPFWGYQDGEIRNTRTREIEEPVFMLNHYWDISEKTTLNTNIGYQFGTIKNSRIDNNGNTRQTDVAGNDYFEGGARNPAPNYYQLLPSYVLRFPDAGEDEFAEAFKLQKAFVEDGQFNWNNIIQGNLRERAQGRNAVYVVQNDVIEDSQLTLNTILSSDISDNITLNSSLSYRDLSSQNYAEVDDLLGSTGYLDIDNFAQAASEDSAADFNTDNAQSDVRNPNRIVGEGDRYKYNYEIDASVVTGFAQAQFKYNKVDFFLGGTASQTSYQRNGLYENGNYRDGFVVNSFGDSEALDFSNFGVKAGLTYKITGRHLFDFNGGYQTVAPSIRNSFTNARQSNSVVDNLESEKIKSIDASYIFRSPIVKARLTGFYADFNDQTDINFFFTESARGEENGNGFVQEVLTGINTRRMGVELGVEAQVTPTIKLKAAASVGQYIYKGNPNQYIESADLLRLSRDNFNIPGLEDGQLRFGDGKVALDGYHVAGGPERAYQLGFEYRDPDFWWVGITGNYFSNAYIDVSTLRRSNAFTTDFTGAAFNDYDPVLAKRLLKQEEIEGYSLVNIVGGKSWRIDDYFVGFFATINNVLDQEYVTGGFEDSRIADFRQLKEENERDTPVFGNRYFFGNGTTYYVNLYVRF